MNVKLNNGLTDLDFDVKNTAYNFSPPAAAAAVPTTVK